MNGDDDIFFKRQIITPYVKKLRSDILDRSNKLSKRLKLINIKIIKNIRKYKSDDVITINSKKFTIKEAAIEFISRYNEIKKYSSSRGYGDIIVSFMKESHNKNEKEINKIYNMKSKEIDGRYSKSMDDIQYCIQLMGHITKFLKYENKKGK